MQIKQSVTIMILISVHLAGFGGTKKLPREVIVKSREGTVRAGVSERKQRVHLKNDRYYWGYYLNGIFCKQGELQGKPLNGKYSRYDLKDNVLETGGFRMGLKEGSWKNLSAEGTLTQTEEYKKGLLHGERIVYKDGKAEIAERYREGILKGKPIYLNVSKGKEVKEKIKKKKFLDRIVRKKKKENNSGKVIQSNTKLKQSFTE